MAETSGTFAARHIDTKLIFIERCFLAHKSGHFKRNANYPPPIYKVRNYHDKKIWQTPTRDIRSTEQLFRPY